MSDLVAIIYPSEAKAEEVRQRLFKLQKEYLITISDAVIAVKTEAGPGQAEPARQYDGGRRHVG